MTAACVPIAEFLSVTSVPIAVAIAVVVCPSAVDIASAFASSTNYRVANTAVS